MKKENEAIRPLNTLKINKAGKAHIHKVIIEECGGGHKIPYVINASTVLLYDPNISQEALLDSIDVLKRDVKLRKRRGKLK